MIKLDNISFDHCIKCTVCTVYCPVARATHLYPGPKQSGPDAERLRIKNPELVDESLKYCSNCKRCEIACPSGVRIADMIQDAKWRYLKRAFFRPRDFFMSRTDLVGRLAVIFSFLANFVLSLSPVRWFMEVLLGIPAARVFPRYESSTFQSVFRRELEGSQAGFAERIVYFHGCHVNYSNHALGRSFVSVMNAMGTGVEICPQLCCGVPLIANGYIEAARKNARKNIRSLAAAASPGGKRVVSASSSCAYALTQEYGHLLDLDNSAIRDTTDYVTKYICDRLDSGAKLPLKPLNMRVAYHAPCHLIRLGGVIHTLDVLKRIPGLDLAILDSECCGISGTDGFKREYYGISQEVGLQLFKKIESAAPEIVVTDCETCRMQIEMNTPYKVLHPAELLAMSLGSDR
jgi:glycerol-3-phosphate dehydrogenase subunit C